MLAVKISTAEHLRVNRRRNKNSLLETARTLVVVVLPVNHQSTTGQKPKLPKKIAGSRNAQ